MTQISREISDLVMEFGGAMSGEHGDGLARSHLNEKLFGPELYKEFRKVKHLFDPQNLLNPGKIVNAPPMTDSLRFGTSYKTWQPDTMLDFSGQGGFVAAVEMCNGTGACRKTLGGTMCPSYMATLEEEHSTRGARHRFSRGAVRQGAALRVHRRTPPRGAGPLPRMQGLQGGMPLQRGHGQAQVRVPVPLPAGPRGLAPEPPVRAHRRPQPLGLTVGAPCQPGQRQLRESLDPGPLPGHRSQAAAAELRPQQFRGMVEEARRRRHRRPRLGDPVPRHLQHLQHPRNRRWRPRACWSISVIGW